MAKKVAEFWYGIENCENAIMRMSEIWMNPYTAGDLWLIRGSERDVLVDTGTGIVSPSSIVKAIANKPVLAVACNSFYDHAGGLHWFEEQGCHRLDAPLIRSPTVKSSLVDQYVLDSNFLAFPHARFEPRNYRMLGGKPATLFEHGDTIDLGDRELEVLAVPGMTAGSIAIWEAATGSLFSCDTLYDDPSERPFNPRNPSAFSKSLEMLSQLPIKTVYGGHFGRFSQDRMFSLIERYFDREAPN